MNWNIVNKTFLLFPFTHKESLSFSNIWILLTYFWKLLLHPGLYTQKGNKFTKIGSNYGIYIKLNLLMVKSGNLISPFASKVVSGQFILQDVCKNIKFDQFHIIHIKIFKILYQRVPARIYRRFTQDLPKIRPILTVYLLKTHPRFTEDLQKIYPRFTQFTKHLPEAYQRSKQDLPKVYQRFIEYLP